MKSRRRRVLSRLLAGVSAFALVLGCLAFYVEHTLFDSQAFADRAVSVLEDEAVQNEIAEKITDVTVEKAPNAVAARPLIESVAEALVSSSALQGLLTRGVEDMHRTVVLHDRRTLLVSLKNIGTLIRSGLRVASPKLADAISKDLDVPLLDDEQGAPFGIVVDAAKLQRDLDVVGWAGLAVFLLAAVGAVMLAATRLVGVRRLGRALAGGGGIALLLWYVGREILTRRFEAPTSDAVGAIFSAFAGDLRVWLLVIAGLGLVLTAGATTTRDPVDISETAGRIWGRVAATPEALGWRVVRGVVLIAVGVFVLANRDFVLDLAVLALGALVVYVGAAELMRLAAGAVREDSATEAARTEAREADLSRGALARIGLVGALLVGAFVGVAFGSNDAERPPLSVDTCNGYAELCERPLNEVAFAATHNSMSAATNPNWFFAQQEQGIGAQLDDGIRALLIDPHYGIATPKGVATDFSADSGSREKIEAGVGPEGVEAAEALREEIGFTGEGKRELFLCHGFCELGAIRFSDGLKEIRDFLIANPGEVVILSIEDATTPEDTSSAIEAAGLLPYIYRGVDGPPWPTLRELIDTNQRLVVMAEAQGGRPRWYRRQFLITQETPYKFEDPAQLERRSSCAANRGRPTASFFLMNNWVDTSPAPRPTNAKVVNEKSFLLKRAAMCERVRGIQPNILAVDFYRQGDVVGAVDELNGVG